MTIEQVPLIKLDVGCGPNKQPEHIGIDSIKFDGVDVQMDVTVAPLPYEDGSVEEIHCSHTFEHFTQAGRCYFLNEAHRVLRVGGVLRIVTPHWANARAYGDPTHVWPPVSEWTYLYANKAWRESNAPHTNHMLSCDFDFVTGLGFDPNDAYVSMVNQEARMTRLARNINTATDLVATLTKRP